MYSNAKFDRSLSQTVWQRVGLNGLVAHPSWVEVIYVIPLYGVSRGLNLNLSSVGGRSLKLTDYYRADRGKALPSRPSQDRGETVWGRGEAEPAKKNCLEAASSRGRCVEDSIPD